MDVDSDDEDFQQTAVAKLFAKQSTNQLQSTRSKRQTKYQNKSNSNPEYNEDNDNDNNNTNVNDVKAATKTTINININNGVVWHV